MQFDTKEKIKNYFRENFDKQTLIKKGLIALAACALVLIFSLSFYFWLKPISPATEGTVYTPFGTNGFWYIAITWNKGVAFSALKDNLPAIFAIQSIVFILLVAIYMFLCKDMVSMSFVACAMFGGLFNLIQRGCTPNLGVLDYFKFGFWPNFAIFNWPDMFVVVGIFGFVISYIVWMVRQKDAEDEAKAEAQQQEQTQAPAQNQ